MSRLMMLLYILFCLGIVVSISIYYTKRRLESLVTYTTYASTENNKAGDVDILGASKFSPECCPHTYTTSSGCLCDTQNENVIISSRGGNKCCC